MAGAAWPYRPPTLRHTWPYRAPCPTLRPTPSLRHTHRQGCPLAQGDLCPAQEGSTRGVRGESEGSQRGTLALWMARGERFLCCPSLTTPVEQLSFIQVEARQHEEGGGANGLCWDWLDRRALTLTLAL